MAVDYKNLPFDEAIAFLRQKVSIPTERWNDLWQGQHARGFMVAGAAKAELLADFRASIDQALELGTTLEEFRKDFDAMVARHGWSYKGARGWRTQTIYSTNLSTAYAAGRYQQMTDPDVLAASPYWIYRHGDSRNPRPLHLAWDGTVLRADDPWWSTHYAPNGWGCSCYVEALSERDLAKLGKTGPDKAPDDGTYQWTDKATGESHTVPTGIDPGWDYNVGEAAWGRPIAKKVIDDQRGGKWMDFRSSGPADFGRPDVVPADAPRAMMMAAARNEKELRDRLTQAIGGESVTFSDPRGETVLVDQAIVDHIIENPKRWDRRERYFPFIPELIDDPYEIWVSFAKNEATGRIALRRRYVKLLELDKQRVLGFVAETVNGVWTGFDMFRGGKTALNNLRLGYMIYGRE